VLLVAMLALAGISWAAVISNDSTISIPESGVASPYPATINVSGLSGTTTDVNVTLQGVSHSFADDVAVLLVGPSGQNVMLMSDAGGGQDLNGVDLTFDDEAATRLPDGAGTQITTGSYRPTQGANSAVKVPSSLPTPAPAGPYGTSLSALDGAAEPNGTYSLYVYDDSSGDAGQIAGGFSLDIKTTADDPTDPPTDPPPTLGKGAIWQMNDPPGSRMFDSSGNNNHGTPAGGVDQTGQTYLFDGVDDRVAVPDTNDSLDPLEKDITLKARVKVPDEAMDDDSYDVVRKGLASRTAGDYKMEVFRTKDPAVGQLHCLFKGTGGKVSRKAPLDIVDGNWHTLECVKTSNSVEAVVDGRSYTATGSTGSISNAKEVLVGAKTTNPFDDMFEGEMDFVSIDIAQ
jgi:concanavalin A-like lectin/glucanase superfamily protein